MYESKPPPRESTEGAAGALCGGRPKAAPPLWGLAFVHSACLTSSEDIKIHQNASRFMPIHPSSLALAQLGPYWAIWALYIGVPFLSVVPPCFIFPFAGTK